MKGKRWSSNKAICPFYKATEPQCIFCSGMDFSNLRISFRDKLLRKSYSESFCESGYQSCDVFKILALRSK